MKKKYKLKKSAIIFLIIILVLIIAVIAFIFHMFKLKSYSLEYNIDDFDISENFDEKGNFYYYEIKDDNIKYSFIDQKEYQKEKRLIKGINKYNYEGYQCLTIESSIISSIPLCSYKEEQISFNIVPQELQEKVNNKIPEINYKNTKYENYTIYTDNNKILIWSYKGFNYINNDDVKFIKLFDKDVYDIPLATKINNYIVIPDYTQLYNFNRVYLINLNNGKTDIWELDKEISYDSYVLGINDKSIFIIDKKSSIEYELVPHRKKMRIVASGDGVGVIYDNGEKKSITLNKLVTKEQTFIYKNLYHYSLKDNILYLSYLDKDNRIKVSNNEVKEIVYVNNDNVYYLVEDTLYKYNILEGEIKLVTYREWNFNYKNLIFIND